MEKRTKRRLAALCAFIACAAVALAVSMRMPSAADVAPPGSAHDASATPSERAGSPSVGAAATDAEGTDAGVSSQGKGLRDSAGMAEDASGPGVDEADLAADGTAQEDSNRPREASATGGGTASRAADGVASAAVTVGAAASGQQGNATPEPLDATDGEAGEADADVATGVEEEPPATSVSGAEDDRPFVMPAGAEYEPEEILIRVDPAASVKDVERLLASIPGIAAQAVDADELARGLVVAELEPDTSVEDGVNAVLSADSDVVAGSQPNYVYHLAQELTVADLRAQLDEATLVVDVETAVEDVADLEGAEAAEDIEVAGDAAGDEAALDAIEPDAPSDDEAAVEAETEPDGQDFDELSDEADDDEPTEPRLSLQELLAASINDPRASDQWALTSMRAYEAWAQATCGTTVAVAVLDNGFQVDHEDLAANIIAGSAYNSYAAYRGEGSTTDVSPIGNNTNHGTHVAGIVGAVANNGVGVAGVSYNARVVPIKVFDSTGSSNTDALVSAYAYLLRHADEHGTRVVCMSLGMARADEDFEDDALFDSVRKAYAQGIVTVVSACNSGTTWYSNGRLAQAPFYAWPSDSQDIVGVINIEGQASSAGNDASGAYTVKRSSSSNYNVAGQGGANTRKGKNISAPGASILSTIPGGDYGYLSGTSMAAPAVAGVLALEFAANPQLSADAAVDVLYASAHDIGDPGWDETYGHGEVDAAEAVRMAGAGGVTTGLDGGGEVILRLAVPEEGYEYDGAAKEPDVEVTLVGAEGSQTQLVRDRDFLVTYADNTDAGLAQATIAGAGAYAGSFEQSLHFTIARRALTESMVGLSSTAWTYDARPLRPGIVLMDDGRADAESGGSVTLVRQAADKERWDYTGSFSYENNEDVGTGYVHVTATGAGNYTGTVSVTCEFAIRPRAIGYGKISAAPNDATYDGTALQPDVLLTHERGAAVNDEVFYTLVAGTDYTLSYENNTEVGTARVKVTGTGNYTGSRTETFQIKPATLVDGDALVASTSYVWTGEAICPEVTVTHEGRTLAEADYTLLYEDNTEVGAARVTATGTGNYTGTATVGYRIVQALLTDAEVQVLGTHAYTGKAMTPPVTVTLDGAELREGADYTASYTNNTEVGTAGVTVTGTGNYAGTASGTFAIAQAANPMVASAKASSRSVTYSATADKTLASNIAVSKAQGTVTYANASTNATAKKFSVAASTGRIGVPQGIAAGTYQVKVEVTAAGNANYKAGSTTVSFKVVVARASLAKATVGQVAAKACTGEALTPTPAVKLGGVTLRKGSDYALSYKNNTKAGTATITVTGKGNYTGTRTTTFRIVAPTVSYRAHCQTYGWETSWTKDGGTSGTTGQSKRLEGIRIKLGSSFPVSGGIAYRAHVQTYGWETSWTRDGGLSGTTGKSKRLEAIQVKLYGAMAQKYDVWYRVHAQTFGWMGWAKNGASAGTSGLSKRLEAIQIVLVPKGQSAPGSTARPYVGA